MKRKLEAAGFSEVGNKANHAKFAKVTAAGMRTAVVPRHKIVAAGTLRSIIRQAGLTEDEFERL